MTRKEKLQVLLFLTVLVIALIVGGQVDQEYLQCGMMY